MNKVSKLLLLALKVYAFTWLLICLWFLVRAFTENLTISESYKQLIELLTYKQFVIFFHVLFLIIYFIVLIIYHFRNVYRNKNFKTMFKQVLFRFLSPILLLYFGINYLIDNNANDQYKYSWNTSYENTSKKATNHFKKDSKFRGMSVFGWHRSNDNDIDELVKNNIEWVAVIPFFYQKDEQTKLISTKKDLGVWTHRDSSFINTIEDLHNKGVHVMLKPHLWMSSGWRSDIDLESTREWDEWFNTYRNVMLHYATMAEATSTDLLCIGTELKTSIKQQPEQWKQLIKDIRAIYSGKLTYAANWYDEFEHVSFWDELDYIGIQAYFPLTNHKNPSLSEIELGWKAHKEVLKAFSKTHNKPILFTEIGYRSDAATTIKPWEWNSLGNLIINQRSTKAQQLAYEALFNSFWNESWFAGCFLWQWDTRINKQRSSESFDFSPKHKPAQNIMAKWYGNHNSLDE